MAGGSAQRHVRPAEHSGSPVHSGLHTASSSRITASQVEVKQMPETHLPCQRWGGIMQATGKVSDRPSAPGLGPGHRRDIRSAEYECPQCRAREWMDIGEAPEEQ